MTFIFDLDGDQVTCCLPGFIDLIQSPMGFGNTKKEALENLLERLDQELEA